MRHVYRNLFLVLGLTLLMFAAINPPSEKLRLGKDLAGGVTLVYRVNLRPQDPAESTVASVIETLKRRIDPDGLFEVQMVRQGRDRIEITMPLPSDSVKALKAEFEAELDKLGAMKIEPAAIDAAAAMPEATRAARLDAMAGGDADRRAELDRAVGLYAAWQSARADYDAAEAQSMPEAVLLEAAGVATTARLAYEAARAEAAVLPLSPDELRRAIELSTDTIRLTNQAGEAVELPSRRERAIEGIKATHPDLVPQIDAVLAKHAAYAESRTSLDDPAELQRLIAGAGVLNFRITVDPQGSQFADTQVANEAELRQRFREQGPQRAFSREARWFKINKPSDYANGSYERLLAMEADPAGYFASAGYVVERDGVGDFWMLCWTRNDRALTQEDGGGAWQVSSAFPTPDPLGRPAIGFTMNARGATLLGALTESHLQRRMAVLLDDEVYTAPNINSRISTNGQITGDFTDDEILYVVRTLGAGSLQARVDPQPLSVDTVAPTLGRDNLDAGLRAGVVAFAVISVFMCVYYFSYGLIAVVGLFINGLLMLGAMALAGATFSMPGIAGVILTFGMAVDANVLIYERIREEFRKGTELREALRLGYERAMSSIVDGNVTNLIVCFVLGFVGTAEIRGFAITMGIGVVTTLITALYACKVLLYLPVEKLGMAGILRGMLPLSIKAIDRVLEPKIDWLKARYVCYAVSTVYVGFGLAMIAFQGKEMLDLDFRGGTKVTLVFEEGTTLRREEVVDRVQALADARPAGDLLRDLGKAVVIPLNPEADGVTSDRFEIKTFINQQQAEIRDAVANAFADELGVQRKIAFDGLLAAPGEAASPIALPVFDRQLGRVLPPGTPLPPGAADAGSFVGGLAIVMPNLTVEGPTLIRPTLADIESRIRAVRQDAFSDTLGREVEVRPLLGSTDAVEAAVLLVRDPDVLSDSGEAFNQGVRDRELELVRLAFQNPPLVSSQEFSSAIAETFQQTAIISTLLSFVLILIYVWVRFGSMRFSIAAVVALMHDVLTAIGLIALVEILYDNQALQPVLLGLGLLPFKIDLNMVAAILTILGYSLNDTIVIMDRIRETKGRLPYASKQIINDAVNQTISRTVITSGTTLISIVILYIWGGEGVRSFAYTLFVGVLVGTYSTVAVAAPLVWSRKSIAPQPLPEAKPTLS